MSTRRRRRFLRYGLILLILLAALVAAAPTLASTGPVRRFVASRIAQALGREVTVGGLEVGWGNGVVVRGLVVANPSAEFGAAALLEVDQVHLDQPLLEILFGGEKQAKVLVDGMVLRLVEEGGGRTNLDDFVRRMSAPRPKPAKRVEQKPLDVQLRNCSIEVRRTPPSPRAVDPFREDPVILPADAGSFTVRLDRFDLSVLLRRDSTRLTFRGGVALNGKGGSLSGSLAIDGRGVRGKVEARGFDLAVLEPLLPAPVAGLLDLDAVAGEDSITLKARAREFVTSLPSLREKWVDLSAVVRPGPERTRIEDFRLATASGEIVLQGGGEVGKTNRFRLKGHAPRRLLFELMHRPPQQGSARFELEGTLVPGRVEAAGSVDLSLPETGAVAAALSIVYDFDAKTLDVDRLEAKADRIDLFLKGRATFGQVFVCDLSGHADADLQRLREVAGSLIQLDPAAVVAGRAAFRQAHLRIDGRGNLAVNLEGEVTGLHLVLPGVLDEEIRDDQAVFRVDAALEDNGNVLRIVKGRVHDLDVSGRIVGLRESRLREMEGSVKGSLPLTPALARMIGADGIDVLSGRLTLDARAATDEGGLRIAGSATVLDLRLNEMRRRRVELRGEAVRTEQHWYGKADLRADDLGGTIQVTDLSRGAQKIRARVSIREGDLRQMLAAVPAWRLPDGVQLAGRVSPSVRIERDQEAWRFHLVVPRTRMTALVEGRGVRNEIVSLAGTLAYSGDRWRLDPALVELGGDDLLRIRPALTLVGRRIEGHVELDGMVATLAAHLPELADLQPSGHIEFVGDFTIDHGLRLQGTLEGRRVALTLEAKRITSDKLTLMVDGDSEGRIKAFDLRLDDAHAKGRGTIGERIQLEMDATGDLAAITPYLPDLAGSGPFRIEVTLAGPRPGRDGRFQASGKFAAAQAQAADFELRELQAQFSLAGNNAGEDWSDLSMTARVLAVQARHGPVRGEEVEIDLIGNGELRTDGSGRGVSFRSDCRMKRMLTEELPFEEVEATLTGSLRDLSLTSRRALALRGQVRFERAEGKRIVCTRGRADVVLRRKTLEIRNLQTTANGGEITGAGHVDLNTEPFRWHGKIQAQGVGITEDLGHPLSHVLPILRLGKNRNRSMTGTLDGEISLAGRGTKIEELKRSLSGGGNIHFRKVELTGSLLLPLLTLRIDRALLRKPYRFDDLDLVFRVRDGRVVTQPFTLLGNPYHIKIDGSTGLDGTLDFRMRSNLLRIPFRVKGTWDHPSVTLSPRDLLGRLFR